MALVFGFMRLLYVLNWWIHDTFLKKMYVDCLIYWNQMLKLNLNLGNGAELC